MKTADTNPETPAWSDADLESNPHSAGDKAGRVRRMFDAIAGRYDINNRLHSMGRDQAWRRRTARQAVKRPGDRVLDVACGTGDLTEAIARLAPARAVGIDFSTGMLEVAIAKAKGMSRTPGATEPEYQQGDAMCLDFEDASFDACTIAFGIRNVQDPKEAFREFYRILSPGGRCLVLEFSEPSNPVIRTLNRIYSRRIMPVTATLISGDRTGAYKYLPRSMETFLSPAELADTMEHVGFTDLRQETMTCGICTLSIGVKPG